MSNRYRDIITLPHHISVTHAPMSARNRAAQFAPFAALTGYDSVIAETARPTSEKPELSEEAEEQIDRALRMIADRVDEHPKAAMTYFVRDELKAGGAYKSAEGFVKRVDEIGRAVIFTDGRSVPIEDILEMIIK